MRVDDLDPKEAYKLLEDHPEAKLVDVRRPDERSDIGAPSLEPLGRPVLHVVWPQTPDRTSQDFADELESQLAAQGAGRDAPLLFICRSGMRSRAAGETMAARGWTRVLNVAGGFSGKPDLTGWADSGLPISKI
jgi:rhodanese-related sulfurtransferase